MHGSMASDCRKRAGCGHLSVNWIVYGKPCIIRRIGTKVFLKGGKQYHVSMIMLAQTSPEKPWQPKRIR
ncbi:hypothetical protein TNCV_2804661 [Trichonephila clavipes]|nr:hypothetical protein TNCV_2804661 [Trichonephila clavipes]